MHLLPLPGPLRYAAHPAPSLPGTPSRAPLHCPPYSGVDFYRVDLEVPEDAYELNFVFSNGDGLFDNNEGQVGRMRGMPCPPRLRAKQWLAQQPARMMAFLLPTHPTHRPPCHRTTSSPAAAP